jgi:hypothetical protein
MSDIYHGKKNVTTDLVENIPNQQCYVRYSIQDSVTIAAQYEERKHALLWDMTW